MAVANFFGAKKSIMAANPEMSFVQSKDEDVPHAYVSYVDGAKECIPTLFIKEFPNLWRRDGWNKSYLYKCFWSPTEGDSPSKMLRRVADIPLYEKGESMEKPGYYRASVVTVKESLKLLEESLNKKRVSCSLNDYKYTSFDGQTATSKPQVKGESDSKQTHKKKAGINKEAQMENTSDLRRTLEAVYSNKLERQTSNVKTSKPTCSAIRHSRRTVNTSMAPKFKREKTPTLGKPPRSSKSTSASGSQKAQMRTPSQAPTKGSNTGGIISEKDEEVGALNLGLITSSVEKNTLVPAQSQTPTGCNASGSSELMGVDKDEELDAMSSGSTTPLATLKMAFEANKKERSSKESITAACKSIVKKENQSDELPCLDPELNKEEVTPLKLNVPPRKRKPSTSSDDLSSDFDMNGRRIKLDPDYTPRKYEEARFQLQMKEQTIKRFKTLNERLQINLLAAEEEVELLRAKNAALEEKFLKLQKDSHATSNLKPQVKILMKSGRKDGISSSRLSITRDASPKAAKLADKNEFQHEKDLSNSAFDSLINTFTKSNETKDEQRSRDNSPENFDSPKNTSETQLDSLGLSQTNDDSFIDPSAVCAINMKSDGENSSSNNDEGRNDLHISSQKNENHGVEEHEVFPGVKVGNEVWKFICDVGEGIKKDKRFVKDLAIVAFGPETLAFSSIFGTKRGQNKKDKDQEVTPRPALNRELLDLVYERFVKRVEIEEKKQVDDPKHYPRTTKSVFHSMIRQAQKKVRDAGYGKGEKDNLVTKDLLLR